MLPSRNGSSDKLSRAQLIRTAARERNEEFPLTYSGGGTALVRKLTLQDLVALDAIPHASQDAVAHMLESAMESGVSKPTELNFAALMKALGGPIAGVRLVTDLASAAVIIGFVDPEVVATAAEITDPDRQVTLDDIDSRDRMAFWEWSQDKEEAEAQSFSTLFQPRPEGPDQTAGHAPDQVPVVQAFRSFEDERS
jgi:hypothetical protein